MPVLTLGLEPPVQCRNDIAGKTMPDFLQEIVSALGGGLAAALAALYAFPKLKNSFTGDRLDGDVLNRLKVMEEHAAVQDRQMLVQNDKIHRYAVRVTKLTVIIIRLDGLIGDKVSLPRDLLDEIAALKAESEGGL